MNRAGSRIALATWQLRNEASGGGSGVTSRLPFRIHLTHNSTLFASFSPGGVPSFAQSEKKLTAIGKRLDLSPYLSRDAVMLALLFALAAIFFSAVTEAVPRLCCSAEGFGEPMVFAGEHGT